MYKYGIIETGNRTGKAAKNVVLTWLFEENGTLSIFGAGMLPDYQDGQPRPWEEYAAEVCAVVVDDGITTIGARTFAGYDKLESVKLPSSLSRIGFRAFADCAALKTVDCSKNIAHVNSTNVASAARGVLREDTVYMGMQSFAGTPWVRERFGDFYIHQGVLVEYYGAGGVVTVPAGVREIGTSAFEGSAVTGLKLPNTLKVINSFAFNKTPIEVLELPASVTKVARYAFAQTEKLNSVLVGNPHAVLESMAFWKSAVEDDVILSKKDRSLIAKQERTAQKTVTDSKLSEEEREALLEEIQEAKRALEEQQVWKAAQESNTIPEDNEWISVYTIESFRESGAEPCKRLEFRRDPKRLLGVTSVKAGEAILKKMSTSGPVIRIRLNGERKSVISVQSFVKDGKDTFAAYLMYPCAGEFGAEVKKDSTAYLTKAEMLELSGEGLWAGDTGCVWYQAPRGTTLGVSAELALLNAWLRKHPEYTLQD